MHSASVEQVNTQGRTITKNKRIPLAEKEWALPEVNWSPSRQKPKLTPGVWDNEVEEELAKYIEWHGRHPHCVTPRKVTRDEKGNETVMMGAKILRDEYNPDLFFTDNGIQLNQISSAHLYKPSELGKDADIDEVSVLASKVEYSEMLEHLSKNDDAWYNMSVKDQLEQSHIDGDHTTVKTRKKKAPKQLSQFEENTLFQKMYYGDYQGGFPRLNQDQLYVLQEAAVKERNIIVNDIQMKKRTPFQDDFVFSKYTINGSALNEFKKLEHNYRIEQAVKQYEVDTDKLRQDLVEKVKLERKDYRKQQNLSKKEKKIEEAKLDDKIRKKISKQYRLSGKIVPYNEADNSVAGTSDDKSTLSSNTRTSNNVPKLPLQETHEQLQLDNISEISSVVSDGEEKEDQDRQEFPIVEQDNNVIRAETPKIDPIIQQRMKIGGDEAIDEMVEDLMKLASQVTKKAKVKANFNLSVDMDILEACEKLRVMKVLAILVAGGSANTVTDDDELLFNICFDRALRMDNVSGDKYLEDDGINIVVKKNNQEYVGSDRDKLQKILEILVRYKANIDSDQFKESMSPIHLAVLSDNVKMVRWLAEKGAKLDKLCDKHRRAKEMRRQEVDNFKKEKGLTNTPRRLKVEEDEDEVKQDDSDTNHNKTNNHVMSSPGKEANSVALITLQDPKNPYYHDDHLSPLMIAAKLGNIACLVELVRHCDETINLNAQNTISGMTCLHYAAMYGQTRIALFLLRIGVDKKVKDKQNRTAAQLAADFNYPSTAQAISAFAVLPKKVAPQLRYTLEQQRMQSAERRRRRQGLITIDPNLLHNLSRKPRFPVIHYIQQQFSKAYTDTKRKVMKILQPKKTKYTEEQLADLNQVKKMHSESKGNVLARIRRVIVTPNSGTPQATSRDTNREATPSSEKKSRSEKVRRTDELNNSRPNTTDRGQRNDKDSSRKERRKKKNEKNFEDSNEKKHVEEKRPTSRQEKLTQATFG